MGKISLVDDGTMDTVLECECGEQFRYNFPMQEAYYDGLDLGLDYDDWVDWCIEDAESDHECESEEENE